MLTKLHITRYRKTHVFVKSIPMFRFFVCSQTSFFIQFDIFGCYIVHYHCPKTSGGVAWVYEFIIRVVWRTVWLNCTAGYILWENRNGIALVILHEHAPPSPRKVVGLCHCERLVTRTRIRAVYRWNSCLSGVWTPTLDLLKGDRKSIGVKRSGKINKGAFI